MLRRFAALLSGTEFTFSNLPTHINRFYLRDTRPLYAYFSTVNVFMNSSVFIQKPHEHETHINSLFTQVYTAHDISSTIVHRPCSLSAAAGHEIQY